MSRLSAFLSIFLTLNFGCSLSAITEEESLFKEAASHYDCGLLEKAKPFFEKLMIVSSDDSKEKASARLYLIKCYYLLEQYEKIPGLFSEHFSVPAENSLLPLFQESLYFLGLSFKKLGKQPLALSSFSRALLLFSEYDTKDSASISLENQLTYEIGSLYFQMEHYKDAKNYFNKLPSDFLNGIRDIRLAQLAIAEKDDKELENRIWELTRLSTLGKEKPFLIAFLRAESFFEKKDWENAAVFYRAAIPKTNPHSAEWIEEAYLYLARSTLNLFEESVLKDSIIYQSLLSERTIASKKEESRGSQSAALLLNETENALKELLKIRFDEEANLTLAQCALYRGLYLKDQDAFKVLLNQLSESRPFLKEQNKTRAALMQAQATEDYEQKKTLFKQLLHAPYDKNDSLHAYTWYLYGLNEYEKAKENSKKNPQSEILNHSEESLETLERAFYFAFPKQPKLAAQIFQTELQVYLHLNTQAGYKNALSLLKKICQEKEICVFLEKEQFDFLEALFNAKLAQITGEPYFFEHAELLLNKTIEFHSKNYADLAKLVLASLYYLQEKHEKAEIVFSELAHDYPPSIHADEALFWASNSAELQGKEKESKNYRKKLFERYPDSPLAAEAFFRLYSYKDYLTPSAQEIDHLEKLKDNYPKSPYVLNSLYFKAIYSLKKEKKMEALDSFEKLQQLFEKLKSENLIEETSMSYFLNLYCRSLLEESKTRMEMQNSNEQLAIAEKNLEQIQTQLAETNDDAQNYLKEESVYQLIKCYSLQAKEKQALALIEQVIEEYRIAKASRGEYLSKALFERGKILAIQQEHLLAIKSFEEAGEAAKGRVLQPDDLFGIWIEQALSLKEIEKVDEAMLLLSRVINYSAVSSKRLQAMYLRAELYEKQGRQELARRQLEALSQQSGAWALKAKEKLEISYIYQ